MLKTLLKDLCTGCIKYVDAEILAYDAACTVCQVTECCVAVGYKFINL
jgi:hypothetical protein